MSRRTVVVVVAFSILAAVTPNLLAQTPPVSASPPSGKETPAPPRATTVFVPYRDLEKTLAGETPGVYLPYEEFLELWGRSFPALPEPSTSPPEETIRTEMDLAGVVKGDTVEWIATLRLTTHRRGWTEAPLGFEGAAMSAFSVADSSEAFVIPSEGGGYSLFLPRAGSYSATLRLSSAVVSEGDSRAVSLAAPSFSIARVSLSIPESGIRPALGRSLAETIREADGMTTILGLLPSGGHVGIRWTRLPAEFTSDMGFLFTTVTAASTIAPDVERLSATITGRVMRAFVRSVRVRLPDGFSLLAAEGDGLSLARPVADGVVEAAFEGPRSAFRLALRLERARPPAESEVILRAPSVLGATRETTYLAAQTTGALRARLVWADNAVRVEVDEWPAPEGDRPGGSFLFRESAAGSQVALAIEAVLPRLSATLDERLEIDDASVRLRARARVRVADAGVFEITLVAPAGYAVVDVGPKDVVREHRVTETDGRQTIVAVLRSRALGEVAIDVGLRSDGDPAAALIEAPIVRVAGAEREDLVYSVAAAVAFNVKVASSVAFDPVDTASLAADRLPPTPFPEPMAFRSSRADAALVIAAERRKTRVTAASRALLIVEEDRVSLAQTILFTVQYAARDAFTILVPEAIETTLDVSSPRLKERTRVGAKASRPGYAEWRITLQSPTLGEVPITVTGEAPVSRPDPGASVLVAAPLVFADEVERETGHVALTRAGNLEIEPRKGESASAAALDVLEPIDPRELPPELSMTNATLAWRYLSTPVSLELDVTRHDYEPVIETAVTHLHVDTVVAESGLSRSVALLEVRNTGSQYLETRLPGDSTLLAAEVNGSPVRPNRRPGDATLLVPLSLTEGGLGPAAIRLLYETRMGDGGSAGLAGTIAIDVPRFAAVPVLRLTLRAYLPEDLVALSIGGSAQPIDDRNAFLEWVSSPTISKLGFVPRPVHLRPGGAALPAPPGDATRSGAGAGYSLDLDIAREGREYLFAKLDGDAVAVVSWVSSSFFGFLRFLALLALPATAFFLVRSGRARRIPFLVVSVVVLGILAPFAPTGLLRLLDSAFLGLLVVAAFFAVDAGRRWMRSNAESYRRAKEAGAEGGAA